MRIDILTLFPSAFDSTLKFSLLGKACAKDLLKINVVDLRAYTDDRHKTADDSPFGGGVGMVLKAEPLMRAVEAVRKKNSRIIVFTPRGKKLMAGVARQLAKAPHLIFVCGHYEEIDQRFYAALPVEEISIGDYVLSGGELPAMVLVDCVARYIPGVVGKSDSVRQDSFESGLLDYPHYTRPQTWRDKAVPDVLTSGNHVKINNFRKKAALRETFFRRPDLLVQAQWSEADSKLLQEIILE